MLDNRQKENYNLNKIAAALKNPVNQQIKLLVQELLIFPLTRLFVTINIESDTDLKKLTAPVVFVGNHPNPPQDVIFMLSTLPRETRRKLVIPGNDLFWNNGPIMRFLAWLSVICIGEFPLNVYGGAVGKSLETIADFIDDSYFQLVMPEGETTPIGVLLGVLKPGLGEILAGTDTKIVPFFVSGQIFKTFARQNSVLDVIHHFTPRGFSKVTVSIGKVYTAKDHTPEQTMKIMREQILALSKGKNYDS